MGRASNSHNTNGVRSPSNFLTEVRTRKGPELGFHNELLEPGANLDIYVGCADAPSEGSSRASRAKVPLKPNQAMAPDSLAIRR